MPWTITLTIGRANPQNSHLTGHGEELREAISTVLVWNVYASEHLQLQAVLVHPWLPFVESVTRI